MVSTGVFTSCKDYDDDIDGLEQKYTDLNTELSAQKTSLEKALAGVQADADAAQVAADAAKAAADAAKQKQTKLLLKLQLLKHLLKKLRATQKLRLSKRLKLTLMS